MFIVFALLSFESFKYTKNYFTNYPAVSQWAFEGDGLESLLMDSHFQSPKTLIVSNTLDGSGIHLRFFNKVYPQLGNLNSVVKVPEPVENSCVIFTPYDTDSINQSALNVKYRNESSSYNMLRCY